MKKRTIIIIVVIALVLAGAAFGIVSAKQRNAAESNDLQTSQISNGDLSAVVDETGEVYADQTAMLSWETTGIAGEVSVSLGEAVKEDQVLATLIPDFRFFLNILYSCRKALYFSIYLMVFFIFPHSFDYLF